VELGLQQSREIRFNEVVVQCKGRMDVLFDQNCLGQHKDKEVEEEPPFWKNHAILNGIVGKLLYGGPADDLRPRLVYTGWIFSGP
jgi:hypothetical protein